MMRPFGCACSCDTEREWDTYRLVLVWLLKTGLNEKENELRLVLVDVKKDDRRAPGEHAYRLLSFRFPTVCPRVVTGTVSRFEINVLIDMRTSSMYSVSMSFTTNFGVSRFI